MFFYYCGLLFKPYEKVNHCNSGSCFNRLVSLFFLKAQITYLDFFGNPWGSHLHTQTQIHMHRHNIQSFLEVRKCILSLFVRNIFWVLLFRNASDDNVITDFLSQGQCGFVGSVLVMMVQTKEAEKRTNYYINTPWMLPPSRLQQAGDHHKVKKDIVGSNLDSCVESGEHPNDSPICIFTTLRSLYYH